MSNELFVLRRLACILRNPPEDDDDEEQIRHTAEPTKGAIEGPPPVEQPARERY